MSPPFQSWGQSKATVASGSFKFGIHTWNHSMKQELITLSNSRQEKEWIYFLSIYNFEHQTPCTGSIDRQYSYIYACVSSLLTVCHLANVPNVLKNETNKTSLWISMWILIVDIQCVGNMKIFYVNYALMFIFSKWLIVPEASWGEWR